MLAMSPVDHCTLRQRVRGGVGAAKMSPVDCVRITNYQ
jgi:hypothetical protein